MSKNSYRPSIPRESGKRGKDAAPRSGGLASRGQIRKRLAPELERYMRRSGRAGSTGGWNGGVK